MFSLFKKPPEIPEELDYLADDANPNLSVPNFSDADENLLSDMETHESDHEAPKKKLWPRLVLGAAVCAGAVITTYWTLNYIYAPVPAEIPSGDILASLSSNPSVAPPAISAPQQNISQSPKQTQAPPAPPASSPPNSPPPLASTPPTGSNSPIPPQNPVKPQQPQISDPLTSAPQVDDKQEPSQDVMSGIFGANPFVDLSSLRSMVTASAGTMDLPHFGGNGNMALPSIPRPDVSPDLLPSPGEIRTPPGPVGAGAYQPPTVGGLIRSSNGNTIAIMGDGAVLSEGDTYKGDRRVTFIGGDGIQFDDGNSISFGGQKQ